MKEELDKEVMADIYQDTADSMRIKGQRQGKTAQYGHGKRYGDQRRTPSASGKDAPPVPAVGRSAAENAG